MKLRRRTDMTGTINNGTVPRSRIESIAGDVDRTVSTSDFKESIENLDSDLYV